MSLFFHSCLESMASRFSSYKLLAFHRLNFTGNAPIPLKNTSVFNRLQKAECIILNRFAIIAVVFVTKPLQSIYHNMKTG